MTKIPKRQKSICDLIEGVLARTNNDMSAEKIASAIGQSWSVTYHCCELLARDGAIIPVDKGRCVLYRKSGPVV